MEDCIVVASQKALAEIWCDISVNENTILYGGKEMTITEILEEIHKERVELEICQVLQQWLLEDRKEWINRAMEEESTIRAIRNIATKTTSPKDALKGIINLCTEDWRK